MGEQADAPDVINSLKEFLHAPRRTIFQASRSVSLFSGSGLSDAGYEAAGFKFAVHCELSKNRAAVGEDNYPDACWIVDDISNSSPQIIERFRASSDAPPDLLVATPPCQGMSSSNPSRGKRGGDVSEEVQRKNELVLDIIPVVEELRPRLICCENVRQLLTLAVSSDPLSRRSVEVLRDRLPDYVFFEGVINIADYGVPQDRRRAIIVGIQKEEEAAALLAEHDCAPWPAPTHSGSSEPGREPWVAIKEWLTAMAYEPLDAKDAQSARGTDDLHSVPAYQGHRYQMLSSIPANSGRNGYENAICPTCEAQGVPLRVATCHVCGAAMTNRPLVWKEGEPRLIRGFDSSYRRMHPDYPSPTITTNTSHIGSDFKIHPWENRVLSTLECSDLQTVPRWFKWMKAVEARQRYAIRQIIGEAFPPYFTYLHGLVLRNLLDGRSLPIDLAPRSSASLGHRRTPKLRHLMGSSR